MKEGYTRSSDTPFKKNPKTRCLTIDFVEDLEKRGLSSRCTAEEMEFVCNSLLLPKSKDKYRFVCTLTGLNANMLRDPYGMRTLDAVLTALEGSSWFSVLDVVDGFFNLPLYPADRVHRLLALLRSSNMRSGLTSTGESGSETVLNCNGSFNHGGVGSVVHGGFGTGRVPETADASPGPAIPSEDGTGTSSFPSSGCKLGLAARALTSLTTPVLSFGAEGNGGKGGKGGPGTGGVA